MVTLKDKIPKSTGRFYHHFKGTTMYLYFYMHINLTPPNSKSYYSELLPAINRLTHVQLLVLDDKMFQIQQNKLKYQPQYNFENNIQGFSGF